MVKPIMMIGLLSLLYIFTHPSLGANVNQQHRYILLLNGENTETSMLMKIIDEDHRPHCKKFKNILEALILAQYGREQWPSIRVFFNRHEFFENNEFYGTKLPMKVFKRYVGSELRAGGLQRLNLENLAGFSKENLESLSTQVKLGIDIEFLLIMREIIAIHKEIENLDE